jgi:hypothetical protein
VIPWTVSVSSNGVRMASVVGQFPITRIGTWQGNSYSSCQLLTLKIA